MVKIKLIKIIEPKQLTTWLELDVLRCNNCNNTQEEETKKIHCVTLGNNRATEVRFRGCFNLNKKETALCVHTSVKTT